MAHGTESFVGVVHSRRYVYIQQCWIFETPRSASLGPEIERPSTRYQPLDYSTILPWLIVRPFPTLGSAVADGSESFAGVVHSRRYVYIQQWWVFETHTSLCFLWAGNRAPQYPLPTSRLLHDPSLPHCQAISNSRKRGGTWQREFCGCGTFTARYVQYTYSSVVAQQ